jgi:hypothetical protein
MQISIKGSQFIDKITGKSLELAGGHTWNNVQRIGGKTVGLNAVMGNFTRLWTIETKAADFSRSRWGSTTSGLQQIQDGPWKSDGSLNSSYYDRMETVVRRAERRDIVTGVVLFEGTIHDYFPGGWANHPFNGHGPADQGDVHTKGRWNRFQRAHVKELVKTLEPYDNVIYEVGNELDRSSIGWFQPKVIQWVKAWTNKPVGVSYAQAVKTDQSWMARIGADWIAPGGSAKVPNFKRPQVLDTDHAWPLRSNVPGLSAAWDQGRPLWLMNGLSGSVLRNQDSLAGDRAFINALS